MAENKSNLWNPQEGKLYDLDTGKEVGDIKDLQKDRVKDIAIGAGIGALVATPFVVLITNAILKHKWLAAAKEFDARDEAAAAAAQA